MEQRGRADGGVAVTWQSVDEYLASLTQRGCSPDTVRAYRRCLARLYRFLPGDKLLRRGTLELWRGELLQTYTPRTVNVNVSAVNSYLEHIGAREFQLTRPLPPPEDDQPEITRAEYLRMLGRARQDGNERAYLLTKVFACTGLTVQELPCVTARAVAEGRVEPPGGDGLHPAPGRVGAHRPRQGQSQMPAQAVPGRAEGDMGQPAAHGRPGPRAPDRHRADGRRLAGKRRMSA